MADEDKAHRERLRKENTRRLRVLELRKARQGDGTDPAVLTEMEEIRATLATLDMAEVPAPATEATAHLRNRFADDFEFWVAQLASLTNRQTHTEEWQSKTEGRLETVERRQDEAADWRGEETRARKWGQRRNFWIGMTTLALVLIAIALAVLP